jgi:hypothetical protein
MQISDPVTKKKVLDALIEISASYFRAQSERDFVKEAIKNIAEETQLPKKILVKMARAYHKQNFKEEVATADEFETLYEEIVGGDSEE